jgi:hypothetical protein
MVYIVQELDFGLGRAERVQVVVAAAVAAVAVAAVDVAAVDVDIAGTVAAM